MLLTQRLVIDSITYLPQLDDIAFGRSPNGLGQFTMLTPTFNGNNDFPNLIDDINESIKIYPNPFSDVLYFDKKENIVVRDILGKIIYSLPNTTMIQTSNWDSGVYFISLKDKNHIVKVIKIK